MRALSLKLKEDVFFELEKITHAEKMPRNRYINLAIEFYNRLYRRNALKKQLIKESGLVYGESMKVLKEFEEMQADD